MLLVRLLPNRWEICWLVRASLKATRKPITNNGRGLFSRMICTARRLWPALNTTISDITNDAAKIPALVA